MVKAIVAAAFVLVLASIFSLLHRSIYQPRFEQALRLQATQQLRVNPAFSGVTVRFEGLDAYLDGKTTTPSERLKAQELIDALPGARVVSSRNHIEVNPTLEIRPAGSNQWSIQGWLPDENARLHAVEVFRAARADALWDWAAVQTEPSVATPTFLNEPSLGDFLRAYTSLVQGGYALLTSEDASVAGQVKTESDRQKLLGLAARFVQGRAEAVHQNLQVVAPPLPTRSVVQTGGHTSIPVGADNISQIAKQLQQFSIYFDSGSTVVKGAEMPKIEQVAALLKRMGPQARFSVAGHADPVGNAEVNRKLSLKRAEAVVAELARRGISRPAMTIEAVGEARQTASSGTTEGRRQSRRVEITLK